jgi:D-beta-D-heptose 7-phosphate kinase/D-beta-D-heptose 1-phosphate adenosyltransferase
MHRSIPDFAHARVLVVGDPILDRYWTGTTERISPEAPVPVVRIEAAEDRVGGAANVAANIVALGGQATLIAPAAADAEGALLAALLAGLGIEALLVPAPGYRTITKLRVLARHQQIIRLDHEDPRPTLPHGAIAEAVRAALAVHPVVVFSDYAKGTLAEIPALLALSRAAGGFSVVDPKGHDFERYAGADLLTPNLKELETVVGRCPDEASLVERGLALCQRLGLQALLITRGEAGMSLLRPAAAPLHLPARARDVFDVTGAGDTVCAVLALALAAGQDLPHAVGLANTAAGIVVGKLGAASVRPEELLAALEERVGEHLGVVDEATLLDEIAQARLQGERICFTNGCFDVLHAGHVAYLKAARALGHRLVVAVNDDASVARLKGEGRPINPLAERMEVLAALACVDWVVPFATDTPAPLIGRCLPDCLVKGGDYAPHQIAGADTVRAHGGEVLVLPFRAGCSTTGILHRLGQRLDRQQQEQPPERGANAS